MRSNGRLSSLLWLALFFLVVLALPRTGSFPLHDQLVSLRHQRQHLPEGSPQAFRLDHRIAELERLEKGEPPQDHPDVFARILQDMKVPADRTEPEYTPGYQRVELSRARLSAKAAGTPLTWVERGPGNVAGRARGLVVDVSDTTGNTWFVGSAGGGVWKTPDAGNTWTRVTTDPQSYATSTIVQCPSQPDVFYVGTGESFLNIDTMNGNGLLKSVDHGVTWTPLASTLDDPRFNNIADILVDPGNPDVVIVTANVGRYKLDLNATTNIFKSTDGGATWSVVFTSSELGNFNRPKKVQHLEATPGDFNVLYAGWQGKGVLKSTDAGSTWTLSNAGITDFSGRFEIAVSPVNPNRVFAAAEGAAGASKLWLSDDAGASWVETTEAVGSEPNWLGAQGWYDNTIVCHPTDPNIVYVGGIQLWRITMVSASTRQSVLLNQGSVHVDHHNLVILPGDGGTPWRMLNTNDGGVAYSSNMDSGWQMPILGLNTTQFYGVDKKPGGSAYIGGMQDNSTWRSPVDPDALTPWIFQIGGDGYETSWHFNDPMLIIGGYQYNGLLRSTDGGETWSSATNGLADTGSSAAPFITKIGKTNLAPDLLFAVGKSGVWRSTDFGASWSLASMDATDWYFSSFMDVRVSRADPQVVWAGARMDGSGSIYLSTDGGQSFTAVPDFTAVTMGGISGLATHPADPQIAYVLFSFAGRPKILRTTDQGQTWQDITGFSGGGPSTNGFPDVAVYDLLVMPHDPNILWAGTEIGLFESTDNGVSWHLADNGLPNVGIWMMTQVEDEIVVATHGLGIWTTTIPAMVAGKTFNPLIESLFQSPSGDLNIETTLRSAYDSTEVMMDGAVATVLPANTAGDQVLVQLPVLANGTVQIQLVGHVGGSTYSSPVKSVDVVQLTQPVFSYQSTFNGGNSDFSGNGFSVRLEPGFNDEAIHSQHNYSDNSTYVYTLTKPIRVAQANAMMEYDEVVLVEPGDSGTQFGDFGFWDYVIVEGTKDGIQWQPLLPGYDCRDDSAWLNAFNQGLSGDASLYRHRSFDLLNTFSWGDTILVRFRLYADQAVNGWGWSIDNLAIQVGSPTGAGDSPPRVFALEQNYPNPFNPNTTIAYRLPERGKVSLRIYDQRGRLVRTLVDEEQNAGQQSVVWDGHAGNGVPVASGVYFYQLKAGDLVQRKKMTLVK